MRILITNDDSVSSAVLIPLVRWAMKLGDVTVCVPRFEQSAKSHAIELRRAFEVKKIDLVDGADCYTVDSTPADCVRYAVLGLNKEYDLVISGINKGYNMGQDIIYSGTVSAVMEGAYLGIKGVAVSTDVDTFTEAMAKLDEVYEYFKERRLFDLNMVYNVNIPPQAEGILVTRQGGAFYTDSFEPIGNDMYQPTGRCVYEDTGDDSIDTNAVMHGHISVTPLALNRTEMTVFEKLNSLTKGV